MEFAIDDTGESMIAVAVCFALVGYFRVIMKDRREEKPSQIPMRVGG